MLHSKNSKQNLEARKGVSLLFEVVDLHLSLFQAIHLLHTGARINLH